MKDQNHTAGPMEGLLQRCIICGAVISDYRNTHYAGDRPPKGFDPGPVYKSGNLTAIGRDDSLEDCSPVG